MVGGGELARAVLQSGLQDREAVAGIPSIAEPGTKGVDFGGPTRLMSVLAFLGQLGPFEGAGELGMQIGVTAGSRARRNRRVLGLPGLAEEAVDSGDAAGRTVAAGELGA